MKALIAAIAFIASLCTASAEPPRVLVDIAPVQGLVARVMQGIAPPPPVLVPPGADPHSYALRPSDARALARADILIWVGPVLTPWLDTRGRETLDLSMADGVQILPPRQGAEMTPAPGGIDPHLWMSPDNAAAWLSAIAARLSLLDPENGPTYRANAAQGQVEIAAAAVQVAKVLAGVLAIPYALDHDDFQYFERRFGLNASASARDVDGGAPGPRRLMHMRRVIKSAQITCMIALPETEPALVITLSKALNPHVLDPLGAKIAAGPGHYPALITAIGAGFAECLTAIGR